MQLEEEKMELIEQVNKRIDRENKMLAKIQELHLKRRHSVDGFNYLGKCAHRLNKENENLKKFVFE